MKQHFESLFSDKEESGEEAYVISAVTEHGCNTYPGTIWIFVEKNEITQGCINRIVDNLNKLAEHNAQNRQE